MKIRVNKTLSVAALALALTGSALAADLPHYKAPPPPPPPPPPLWTGFYVGLNAGGTWSNSNSIWTGAFPLNANLDSAVAAVTANSVLSGGNNGGFIGGGQIGYNWQFYNGAIVAGVEADIQGIASSVSSGRGAAFAIGNDALLTFSDVRKNLDYIGTVRGRLGWLFTPTLLVYGTGGLAYGGVNLRSSLATLEFNAAMTTLFGAGFGSSSFSDTRVGWTAGGGLEWMFWPNWSAKVEYLYYDLGSVAANGAVVVDAPTAVSAFDWTYAATSRARFNGNIVRAGVNYHFNWGAPPVVAKY